jgi:thiamine-phosphate pyrophosphorylase
MAIEPRADARRSRSLYNTRFPERQNIPVPGRAYTENVLRCYITDRKLLPSGTSLLDVIARNLQSGVDWIQIREKDLSSRELHELVTRVVALPRPPGAKILVNTRIDVALAAGADGVHFSVGFPPPSAWRAIVPNGFLFGVSCHTIAEIRDAQAEGAGYAVFGPVFAPRSKTTDLSPRGLAGLRTAAKAVTIPILALGGISQDNAQGCVDNGAAGIAAITMFQSRL